MKQNRSAENHLIIGLTGGIGSGKTTLTNILREKKFSVIDADAISRKIMDEEETSRQVINCFGERIVDSNGKIDRRKLREIVFKDDELLGKLNKIFHEKIRLHINKNIEKLKKEGKSVIFIDAPLLIENKLDKMVDEVWIVYCSIDTQIERVMKRDNSNRESIEQIMKRQMPLHEKLKHADICFQNEGSINELKVKLESALTDLEIRVRKKVVKG